MTIIWCMAPQIWSMTDKIFCYFRPFLPFYPTKNQKNNKNACIILHKCTKNYDHMLYCSWDMVLNGYDCYYPYWAIFCPFTPLTDQKIKIKKMQKKKKPGDIIILHICTKYYDQMMYSSWYMVYHRWTDRWREKVTYRGGCPKNLIL